MKQLLIIAKDPTLPTAVAAASGNFLVVWTDFRNTPANVSEADIFGARVEVLSGKVLDTNGIAICTAPYDQNYPSVSSYGDHRDFFIVWQDARDSGTNQPRLDIYGARLAASALVLDPAGIPICTATNNQMAPSVAGGSTNLLVAWTDFRKGSNSDIYGARIDESGAVLDPDSFAISAASNSQSQPKVAFRSFDLDERYFVVWTDARTSSSTGLDIYGAHVSSSGVVVETNGIPIRVVPNQQSSAAVAPGGPDFFVLWQEATDRTTNNFNIYATLVTDIDPKGVRSASLLVAAPNDQGPELPSSRGVIFVRVPETNAKVEFDGFRQSGSQSRLNRQTIDNHLDVVAHLSIELQVIR
jgi:hypothetical protein